tara:strand:- start:584 stop:1150 length:567 start_codon:yes stop_codon:yes gene_type:complete
MDNKYLKEILNEYGKSVVEEAKKNLTEEKNGSGNLYNSIKYILEVEENLFLLDFLMEDYGPFVDQGVKGADPSLVTSQKTGRKGIQKAPYSKFKYTSKKPPLEMLVNWAKSKNVRFRVKKGQKGGGQFKKGSYRQMGFWLQKSIYAQGLKPTNFFTKPFQQKLNGLGDKLFDAFALDIENAIILGQKR